MKRLSLKQLHELIKEGVDEAAQKWSDLDVLRNQIHRHLCLHVEGVVGALLGLRRNSFRETDWEVIRHHPELVNGSSALASNLDKFVKEEVLKWLAGIIENPPTPTKSQMAALKKYYSERYFDELQTCVRRLATKRALEDAQALVEKELAVGTSDDLFHEEH